VRIAQTGAVALIVACALSTVFDAHDWNVAGRESRRLLTELRGVTPAHGHLIVLSVPTDYHAAHLFPDALDVALHESGRPDTGVTTCASAHAIDLVPGQVSFRPAAHASWIGRSTVKTPFDLSVLGGSPGVSAGCSVARAPGSGSFYLGTAASVVVTPGASPGPSPAFAYFDGRDMKRVRR
jgi:hypothetical protein